MKDSIKREQSELAHSDERENLRTKCNKVRITAIRQTVYPDLMEKYENPIEHTCDVSTGMQWVSIDGQLSISMGIHEAVCGVSGQGRRQLFRRMDEEPDECNDKLQ